MSEKSKTPYELRFNMLEMARSMHEQQFYLEREMYDRANHIVFESAVKSGNTSADDIIGQLEIAKYPTFEEIEATAKKFNKFISTGE